MEENERKKDGRKKNKEDKEEQQEEEENSTLAFQSILYFFFLQPRFSSQFSLELPDDILLSFPYVWASFRRLPYFSGYFTSVFTLCIYELFPIVYFLFPLVACFPRPSD